MTKLTYMLHRELETETGRERARERERERKTERERYSQKERCERDPERFSLALSE